MFSYFLLPLSFKTHKPYYFYFAFHFLCYCVLMSPSLLTHFSFVTKDNVRPTEEGGERNLMTLCDPVWIAEKFPLPFPKE